jgi:hypothetical protein
MTSPLSLSTVAALLGDQSRSFSDVYKLYGFGDEQAFSEYVEFFLHEPVAWFEGLPSSLKSKASFAKPKTAFSKALKHGDVIATIGAEECEAAVAILWATYKKESDRIVAARGGEKMDATEVNEVHDASVAPAAPAASAVPAAKPQRLSRKQQKATAAVATEPVTSKKENYEAKYRLVDKALRAFLLSAGGPQSDATLVFLDALRDQ